MACSLCCLNAPQCVGWRTLSLFSAMVQQLHERDLYLADGPDGLTASHLSVENSN